MAAYGSKACLVVDNGSFLELAIKLSKSFGKVWYHSSWVSAFPTTNAMMIGAGIEGVERVDDFWRLLPDLDLIVFPDLYFSGLQTHLDRLIEMNVRGLYSGLRIWGSRWGDELELDRAGSKKHLAELGIQTGEWRSIKGLPALREYLKHHSNKWVKISTTRGDGETFFSKNYKLAESVLDEFEHFLGAGKLVKEFIVEDDIPDSQDIAADIYCVDGQFPTLGQISHEVKDRACVGVVMPETEWPKQIRDTNAKISETLKIYGYRNYWAGETRVTKDGKGYMNDPCARLSAPPGGELLEQYTNTAEIIWEGANGKLVDPVPAGKWGVSLVIYSSWAEKNWLNIEFPAKIRDQIKLKNFAVIDGRYYVVPQATGLVEIGEVVATGDTLEEAREACQEYAEQVEGQKVRIFKDSLNEAEEELDKLKEYGITLG